VKKCEACKERTEEGYKVTLRLCPICLVDLEVWLEKREPT